MSEDLRRAVAALSPRERDVVQHQAEQAAVQWAGPLPRLTRMWTAFAEMVGEISAQQRARGAAGQDPEPLRSAAQDQAVRGENSPTRGEGS